MFIVEIVFGTWLIFASIYDILKKGLGATGSLTSVAGKVLKGILRFGIHQHLHRLIGDGQHGSLCAKLSSQFENF